MILFMNSQKYYLHFINLRFYVTISYLINHNIIDLLMCNFKSLERNLLQTAYIWIYNIINYIFSFTFKQSKFVIGISYENKLNLFYTNKNKDFTSVTYFWKWCSKAYFFVVSWYFGLISTNIGELHLLLSINCSIFPKSKLICRFITLTKVK